MQKKLDRKGFSIVEVVVVIVIVAAVAACGWLAWRHTHGKKKPASSTTASSQQAKSSSTSGSKSTKTRTTDPYAGWKAAVSPRAKFSIKYPSSWTYSEALGDRDNVEHITLSSANIQLTIDSYQGTDPQSGGQANTACPDCSQTLKATSFNGGNIGSLDLDTIIYNLDSGKGNALVLEQANGTYYIPSPTAQGVSTSFRAISNLASLAAYQAESPQTFAANPDFATAQKILESISY